MCGKTFKYTYMYSLLKPDFNVNIQTNGVKTEVNFKGTIL